MVHFHCDKSVSDAKSQTKRDSTLGGKKKNHKFESSMPVVIEMDDRNSNDNNSELIENDKKKS